MTFECSACGECFEDRLDHVEVCVGPFPASWWDESNGDVLWWCWKDDEWLVEAPYVGSPLDCGMTVECHTHTKRPAARFNVGGWPAYHTHWTQLPKPPKPPIEY